MKNSDFVNALADDIDRAAGGGPVNVPTHKEDDAAEEEGKELDESTKPTSSSVADDIQKQSEAETAKLVEENEAVIADMVKNRYESGHVGQRYAEDDEDTDARFQELPDAMRETTRKLSIELNAVMAAWLARLSFNH